LRINLMLLSLSQNALVVEIKSCRVRSFKGILALKSINK
jgi:hypothetical protein